MTHTLGYLHSDWYAKAVVESDSDIDIVLTTPHYEDFTGRNVVVSLLVNVHEM